jgi:RNA polymerase II subunit A-like phosphatase
LLPVHPDDRGEPLSPGSQELAESSWLSSSDEATGSFWTDDEGNPESEIFKDTGLDETSHIGYDEDEQAAVHDELKEFLGSDDESESDGEAWGDEGSAGRKRKRGDGDGATDDESGEDEENDTDQQGSKLSQRIKRSYKRSTGLREVASVAPTDSDESRMTLQADEEEQDMDKVDTNQEHNYENPDDDDDDLEREMLAAFEDDDDNIEDVEENS